MRGERIGLVGNNGVGKSTLLKILLGEIEPESGSVKLGLNLEIGYFDQMRRDLDPEKTVAEVVGDGSDTVLVDGRERHIIGYLRGFLFSAERAKTPIKALSGGECNRVILARLFTRPSNLLVLDEPTNDLDVETLDVLEARLSEYSGTLIVVSHDRAFMDNVVTSVLVFEDSGKIEHYWSIFLNQRNKFKERYGQQDLPELEDNLRNVFKNLGELTLFLKQKMVEPEESGNAEAKLTDVLA
jgi:ATP-binding cassette subfamily F protein uup